MTTTPQKVRRIDEHLREIPVKQGTDEWIEARLGMVTASVVGQLLTSKMPGARAYPCPLCSAAPDDDCTHARTGKAIAGVHKERTAAARGGDLPRIIEPLKGDDLRSLVLVLAAERIAGFADEHFVSYDMQRGWADEPLARDFYTEHHTKVDEAGLLVRTFDGFEIGYSPDGLVGDDGSIEVKSRRGKKHVATVLDGDVPPENYAQLMCGLLVSGRAWIDYVSYAGGMALWVKRVHPDPVWFDAIIRAAAAFEQQVTAVVDAYTAATEGLPITDRPAILDML